VTTGKSAYYRHATCYQQVSDRPTLTLIPTLTLSFLNLHWFIHSLAIHQISRKLTENVLSYPVHRKRRSKRCRPPSVADVQTSLNANSLLAKVAFLFVSYFFTGRRRASAIYAVALYTSVCQTVCLHASVTCRCSVKTSEFVITQTTPHDSR